MITVEDKRKHRDNVLIGCTIGLLLFFPVLSIALALSQELFPSFWGSENLGNGLYYVFEDPHCKGIVHSYKARGFVNDGIKVIPDVSVTHVSERNKYIIVTGEKKDGTIMYYLIDNTFHVDKNKYFIYDREKDRAYRDSVIKHHISSFNDSLTLFRALEDREGAPNRVNELLKKEEINNAIQKGERILRPE